MVILQAKCMLHKDEISKREKLLSKKIGKKVIIIPSEFDIIDLKMDEISFFDWVLNKLNRGNNG